MANNAAIIFWYEDSVLSVYPSIAQVVASRFSSSASDCTRVIASFRAFRTELRQSLSSHGVRRSSRLRSSLVISFSYTSVQSFLVNFFRRLRQIVVGLTVHECDTVIYELQNAIQALQLHLPIQ